MNNGSDCDLLSKIRSIHSELKLSNGPDNDLLKAPDEALLYLLALLRDEPVKAPALTAQQWAELVAALNPLWILPLLFCKVRGLPGECRPPGEVVEVLRREYLRSAKYAILADRQLKELIDALNKENIRFLVLKGAALSRSAYADPAMRPCTDIDLLVWPGDVVRAGKAIESLGYECGGKLFDSLANFYNEDAYSHSNKNYRNVEIHWALNPFSLVHDTDVERLFKRAVKIEYRELSFSTLGPVDTLVHLSMHMAYGHSDNIRLHWIYDIRQVCSKLGKDDWDVLQKRSIEDGARLPVEYVLGMAQYWTGLKIPFDFGDWPAPTKNDRKAFDYLAKHRHNSISQFRLLWPNKATPAEKIRVMFYLIFPPASIIRATYPPPRDWLLPASYVKRWLTIIWGSFK